MASPPRYPDTNDDTGIGPDPEATTGTSRWVYALWIIVGIALILLLVVLHHSGIMGPGLHGGH